MGICLTAALSAAAGCATQAPAGQPVTANNPRCITDSTHIQNPDGACRNVPGTSYTQQDIQSTGQTNPADALKRLDPRVQ